MNPTVKLILGDCLTVLPTLDADSIDAVVTDPPYHLTQASRKGSPRVPGTGPFGRVHLGESGFMGKTWDGGGIAFDPATWEAAARVLKPGGYLLAFGGTRTFHRLACAIEDAGFEMRDTLMWLHGQGFPKNRLTALKPAWEPIIMARRPLIGSVAANIAKYGTGGLNIDACRIGTAADLNAKDYDDSRRTAPKFSGKYNGGNTGRYRNGTGDAPAGRWPSNLVLSHLPGCNGTCAPGCPVAELDAQSGITEERERRVIHNASIGYSGSRGISITTVHGGRGGASRFFQCFDGDADPGALFRYVAKPSAAERSKGLPDGQRSTHPTVKSVSLMRWLIRLVTPPGGTVLDMFAGSGSTGIAAVEEGCSFIGIEREPEYYAIAEARIGAARPAPFAIAPGAGESGISRRRTGAAPRRASPVSDNAVCASRIAFRDAQRELFENIEQLRPPHPEAV